MLPMETKVMKEDNLTLGNEIFSFGVYQVDENDQKNR